MIKKTTLIISLAVVAVAMLSACGSSKALFVPSSADVVKLDGKGIHTDLERLHQGYKLYSRNCGGCHALVTPSAKTEEQWNQILPKMFPKTKLDENQQEMVKNYILSKL